MNKFPIIVNQDNVKIEFGENGGGFPARIFLKEGNGAETVIVENNMPPLLITLGDGRQVRPFIPDDCVISRYSIAGGAASLLVGISANECPCAPERRSNAMLCCHCHRSKRHL